MSLVISRPLAELRSRPTTKTPGRYGKFLIVIGTLVAFLGIVTYCTTMMIGDLNHEPARYLTEGLMIIGAGLAIWLIGAFNHLNAAMGPDPSEDQF